MDEDTIALVNEHGTNVVIALAALFFGWIVARFVKKGLEAGFAKSKFDETLARFFSNMARYAILTFTVLGVLGRFGIETSSFAALVAAGGLAVGLAFQGTLSNFAAGVMILVFRPFKIGDLINVAGVLGTVKEIELFTVELATLDNRRIVVPNGAIFGSTIENITHYDTRRVDIDVGVDYSFACDDVRPVLEAMAPNIPGVLTEPAPQIFLAGLGGSSVDWQVRVWCKTAEYWDVHQATISATKAALDAANIGIPYPQMDLHLDESAVKAIAKS